MTKTTCSQVKVHISTHHPQMEKMHVALACRGKVHLVVQTLHLCHVGLQKKANQTSDFSHQLFGVVVLKEW